MVHGIPGYLLILSNKLVSGGILQERGWKQAVQYLTCPLAIHIIILLLTIASLNKLFEQILEAVHK